VHLRVFTLKLYDYSVLGRVCMFILSPSSYDPPHNTVHGFISQKTLVITNNATRTSHQTALPFIAENIILRKIVNFSSVGLCIVDVLFFVK
jgi:hypothetical protein